MSFFQVGVAYSGGGRVTDRTEEALELAEIVAVLERGCRRRRRRGNRAGGGGGVDHGLRPHPHRGGGEEGGAGRLHRDEDARAAARDGLSARKLNGGWERWERRNAQTHQLALQDMGNPLEQSSEVSSQHSSITPAIQPLCIAIMSVHEGAACPRTVVATAANRSASRTIAIDLWRD